MSALARRWHRDVEGHRPPDIPYRYSDEPSTWTVIGGELMRSLQDLATALTPSPFQLRVLDESARALRLVHDVPTGYIWPNLRCIESAENPRIAIVVAAGAVGKSAAATALAASLQWPLVDAASAQVGSYSLSGLLHDALGFESNYMAEVASGRAGIIIDALDEAHLRAGTNNLQAFLDNIRKIAGSGHANLSIVLFSRPDTAEIVKLFFTETETPQSVLNLDFFDYKQACAYLQSQLEHLNHEHPERDYGVAAKHPKVYAQLRDKRMREIAETLLTRSIAAIDNEWPSVAEFLGYAPVLSVLAEYLAVPNPSKELSRPLHSGMGTGSILLQIIENLLTREQKKFQEQVSSKLLAELPATEEWQGMEDTYSPQEQGIRLVAKFLNLDFVAQPPALLPPSLRAQYDQDAGQFTADHPFLAGTDAVNVVFSDYLLAKAAAERDCHIALKPDPREALKPVGPFFYQFVHEFAPGDETSNTPDKAALVSDSLISLLLDSYGQSQINPNDSLFVYVQSGESAVLLISDHLRSGGKTRLEFEVSDLSGVLILPSKVARGVIFTDGGVVLGEARQRFLLGPAVVLHCGELDIEAEHLSVDATGAEGAYAPCVIRAEKIRVMGKLAIDASRADALTIYGEGGWAALRPYMKAPPGGAPNLLTQASYVDLRAILKAFRQRASDLPSVYDELMDQRIVKNNPTRKRFLAKLLSEGIVYQEASHYYLRTSKLTELGINWHSVVDGAPTDSVLSFLATLNSE